MATRKQKHAAAVAKRAKFMEGVKQSGLAAQQKDRADRADRDRRISEEARAENDRFHDILAAKLTR